MQLLKSLLCRQGKDNKLRFIIISLFSFCLIVLVKESVSTLGVFSLIVIILLTVTIFFSSIRRCNDGSAKTNLAFINAFTFLFTSLLLISIESNWIYFLSLFPSAVVFLLATYPETENNKIMGYAGPVDLSETNDNGRQPSKQRIEPSFATCSIPDNATTIQKTNIRNENTTIAADLRKNIDHAIEYIFPITKQKLVILLTCLILLSITVVWLNRGPKIINNLQVQTQNEEVNEVLKQTFEELHLVTMPDNFNLYTTTDENIVIKWQADSTSITHLWSQKTAKGDKSCTTITFNNGDKIRTIDVTVKGLDTYHAIFSPLDQQQLLTNMAKRSNFKLCGYNFSLKGSLATLNKNIYYRDRL